MQSNLMTGIRRQSAIILLIVMAQTAHAGFTGGKGGVTSGGTDHWGTTYSGAACIGDGTGGKSGSGSYSNDNGCVPYVPGIDDDGDGMPSTWEMTYNLNKYNNQDRMMDIDVDGVTNIQEYNQGTAPTTDIYGNPPNPKDTDGDGCPDNIDPNPTVAGSCVFAINSTYKGVRVQQGSDSP